MQKTAHVRYLGAALLSGLLLALSWQPYSLFFLVFIGFVPLLWVERKIRDDERHSGWVFVYGAVTFFTWNICSTWWLFNSTVEGAFAAFIINTLVMSLPLMLYHSTQKRMQNRSALMAFICYWIATELIHLSWEITWPWLTLGNVFSSVPQLAQWYAWTGALGGSFWILFVNTRLFTLIVNWNQHSRPINFSRLFNLVFFLLFAPAFLSLYIGANFKPEGKPLKVMVVQPNIDPYKEKFNGMPPELQTQRMLDIASTHIDSTVGLVCFPETALVGGVDEGQLLQVPGVRMVQHFLEQHPNVTVITGADTYRFYKPDQQHSVTARKYNNDLYYDAYNTALMLDKSGEFMVYHKSKLVPGVERMPYPQVFGFLEKMALDMGGTSGSLGMDEEVSVFRVGLRDQVAPVICYESIFGEYVGAYMRKGAGLICIITNDGWWGNTPGYHQHFDYARLRAIENRKYVARSANTGTSGFIDPLGNVISKTEWWTEDAQTAELKLNYDLTFYAKYGDYIGHAALVLSALYLLMAIGRRRRDRDIAAA